MLFRICPGRPAGQMIVMTYREAPFPASAAGLPPYTSGSAPAEEVEDPLPPVSSSTSTS